MNILSAYSREVLKNVSYTFQRRLVSKTQCEPAKKTLEIGWYIMHHAALWLFNSIYWSRIAVHRLFICQGPDNLQFCVSVLEASNVLSASVSEQGVVC
jgi:hypothetical protein